MTGILCGPWTTARSSRPLRLATRLVSPAPMTNTRRPCTVTAAGCLPGRPTPPRPCSGPLSSPLPPSLYAGARDECYNQLHATEPGLGQLADIPARPPNAPEPTAAERRDAEVRRTIRATMAELNPRERELIELSLRHDLNGADLAVVLDVSWNRAHALV